MQYIGHVKLICKGKGGGWADAPPRNLRNPGINLCDRKSFPELLLMEEGQG